MLPVCMGLVKCLVQCEFTICSVKGCIICEVFVQSLVFSMYWHQNLVPIGLAKNGHLKGIPFASHATG